MAHPCSQCDASFPVRKSMLNHKRLKHGDTKQFNCKLCVYATTKKDHLEQHVRSVHKKVKETCETCGKEFSDKSNLNKHVRQLHTKTQVTKRKASDTLEIPTKRIKMDNDIFNSKGREISLPYVKSTRFRANNFPNRLSRLLPRTVPPDVDSGLMRGNQPDAQEKQLLDYFLILYFMLNLDYILYYLHLIHFVGNLLLHVNFQTFP